MTGPVVEMVAGVEASRANLWPPYEPGNRAAEKHGATSAFRISQAAQEVMAWVEERAPWLVADLDVLAVERFCRVEARARLYHSAIEQIRSERGIDRVPEYLLRQARSEDALADRLAGGLGLVPEGRARLVRDSAVARHYANDALAALQVEGRQLRLQAESRHELTTGETP